MILELQQLLWVHTPKGEGVVKFLLDYGPDADLMWVVVQGNGEIWTWSNWDVRVCQNITLGLASSSGPWKTSTSSPAPSGKNSSSEG